MGGGVFEVWIGCIYWINHKMLWFILIKHRNEKKLFDVIVVLF
ncbi:putative membrane protein [Candidatus Neoehrlichia lotoris str. RAC413]|uniref:Putative membrane protein n=1 Tax=Candidatus Neoehrlichia procyonis str. RAC413 TaxID=1359163 RepID=A0A0F3NN65_9RICK|nr:putative membrane protein [Candidatus Neoehrlichia lotoris str. RAC413]